MKRTSAKPLWREWFEALLVSVVIALLITTFVGRLYVVEGASMENTLYDGQRLIVDKISYRFVEPSRGEIIVLKTPNGDYIKRIIAVGGDIIEERNGVVLLNDQPLAEPYVTNKTRMNGGPYIIPENHYWVMGDNRPNSVDSRSSVGFLAKDNIIGRAILRFWPINKIAILL